MQDIVSKNIKKLTLQKLEFVIPCLTRIIMMKLKELFNNISKMKIHWNKTMYNGIICYAIHIF